FVVDVVDVLRVFRHELLGLPILLGDVILIELRDPIAQGPIDLRRRLRTGIGSVLGKRRGCQRDHKSKPEHISHFTQPRSSPLAPQSASAGCSPGRLPLRPRATGPPDPPPFPGSSGRAASPPPPFAC